MMTFLYLFLEFFKIGLFAVGGGPATIPFLQDLARSDYGWFNEDQLGVMVAVAESTPGPIGVNMATYAGFNAGGILGGIIATIGLVSPSVIIIIVVVIIAGVAADNGLVVIVQLLVLGQQGQLHALTVLNLHDAGFHAVAAGSPGHLLQNLLGDLLVALVELSYHLGGSLCVVGIVLPCQTVSSCLGLSLGDVLNGHTELGFKQLEVRMCAVCVRRP